MSGSYHHWKSCLLFTTPPNEEWLASPVSVQYDAFITEPIYSIILIIHPISQPHRGHLGILFLSPKIWSIYITCQSFSYFMQYHVILDPVTVWIRQYLIKLHSLNITEIHQAQWFSHRNFSHGTQLIGKNNSNISRVHWSLFFFHQEVLASVWYSFSSAALRLWGHTAA